MSDAQGVRGTLRRFLALERDVLVLSLAMFAFSLGFQMTGRYVPRYLSVLGAALSPSASSAPRATSSRRPTPTLAAPSPTGSARGWR